MMERLIDDSHFTAPYKLLFCCCCCCYYYYYYIIIIINYDVA